MRAIAASVARVKADPTLDDTENKAIERDGHQLGLFSCQNNQTNPSGKQIMPLYGTNVLFIRGIDEWISLAQLGKPCSPTA